MNAIGQNERRSSNRWCATALVLLIGSATQAASVSVGNHVLLPNTANQVVSIFISGGEQVAGEDFFAQIGDGGTYIGGSNTKPAFTNVDITGGTIFNANNNGAFGDPNGNPPGSNAAHPLLWIDGTTTSSGTVAATGKLATLTFDTTGLASGTFPLLLTGVAPSLGGFNTTLRNASGQPIPLTITNGSLNVAIPANGDFNQDGVVDAADYVVWRNGLGPVFTQSDYTVWRAHFGQTFSNGSVTIAVPEPKSWVLSILGFLALALLIAGQNRARSM